MELNFKNNILIKNIIFYLGVFMTVISLIIPGIISLAIFAIGLILIFNGLIHD